ncbi:MAG: methionyl-tRNA formyltransferase [Rhodospirillaceae bacterium]|jgi:methionyl-tRNA formyltransferase|nr:methionyl-tRNA formyltransferase [Rhodospirillaceae bacterium]MBT4939230.1 methionyl-tRNA formyltransferase [Rhodospirillaceae bacterium]MBT7265407.1 methionyl-tRNA formyltransferase [Rhodospirillaceae bacterium]
MSAEIVLLTGDAEVPHLTESLLSHRPDLVVTPVLSLPELEQSCQISDHQSRRLIAYCTSLIVPAEILNTFSGLAYNFHPGPPTYPGVYPANFAIYDGASRFGVTSHAMTEKVDEGSIVGTEAFDIAPGSNFNDLEIKAYLALFELFKKQGPALVKTEAPLAELDIQWGSRKTTMQEYENLRNSDPVRNALLNDTEKARRHLAFGNVT